MPELRCTVQTCRHNADYYCDLEGIVVGGGSARRPEETCCDSFEQRTEGASGYSMSNAYNKTSDQAFARSEIDCKAVECAYNDECRCHAGKISVEGGQASQSEETACATFTCGCA